MKLKRFALVLILFSSCVVNVKLQVQTPEATATATTTNEVHAEAAAAAAKARETETETDMVKVKRYDHYLMLRFGGLPPGGYYRYGYTPPHWLAGAALKGDANAAGTITFLQLPYNNGIRVSLNASGMPAGRHALHIHTYGDISEGCNSTGPQFPTNFLGNIEVADDGSISTNFMTVYLNLFGFNGIIGRSAVVHSKPIDLNTALNVDAYSQSQFHSVPPVLGYRNDEKSVGPAIACGVISIMKNALDEQ